MNIIQKLGLFALTVFSVAINAETLVIKSASDWGKGVNGFPPANVYDGSLATDSSWRAKGYPAHIVVDLGEVQSVTDVAIAWADGKEVVYLFEVWARADSSDDWEKVLQKQENSGNSSNLESYELDDTIKARYVRIKVRENSAGSDESNIKEIRIYNGQPSADNKAQLAANKQANKKQTAKVETGSTVRMDNAYQELLIDRIYDDAEDSDKFPPKNAVDGNIAWSSRWAGSNSGKAVNLIAQFDQPVDINEIGIAWGEADKRTHTFEIYARPESSGKWIRLHKGTSKLGHKGLEIYDIEDMEARQVRVKARFNSDKSEWMEITELKIFGGAKLQAGQQSVVAEKSIQTTATSGGGLDWSIWDIRGKDPKSGDSLVFDALKSKFTTASGKGWRNELKIKKNKRAVMSDVYEEFKARVSVNLSKGSKTIIAQYYTENKGPILKLYISDAAEKGVKDGKANNGIFDVYAIIKEEHISEVKEVKTPLGTIKSGEEFSFKVSNIHSFMTVSAMGESTSTVVEDSSKSYLTFGNYLQAQDAKTGKYVKGSKGYAKFFKRAGIKTSELTFSDINYTRSGL